MRFRSIMNITVLVCVLALCLATTVFATNVNQSSAPSNNINNSTYAGGIAGYVPNNTNNSSASTNNSVDIPHIVISDSVPGSDSRQNQSQISNLYSGTIQDESMLIIPIATMLEEGGGGLLFTALLSGIVIGIVGTLAVQRIRKGTSK